MYRKVWNKCQGAICAIDFYSQNGIRFNSVTGFKYRKYLVTDDMVYKIENISEVRISFMENDGCTIKASIKITEKDFFQRMVKGIRENIPGLALFDIDFPQFDEIPSLEFSTCKKAPVAAPIAVIGYSFDNTNLAIKPGIVSSYAKQKGTKYIQFDSSTERGNSGSPLIDVETCEVIGIVGHRLANIDDNYKQMIEIINNNVNALKNAEGKIMYQDIDPIQVLIANQNQIKRLAQELFRTASFTYGFALDVNQISGFFDIAELEKGHLVKVSVLDQQ